MPSQNEDEESLTTYPSRQRKTFAPAPPGWALSFDRGKDWVNAVYRKRNAFCHIRVVDNGSKVLVEAYDTTDVDLGVPRLNSWYATLEPAIAEGERQLLLAQQESSTIPALADMTAVSKAQALRVLEPDEKVVVVCVPRANEAFEPEQGDLLVTSLSVTRMRYAGEGPFVSTLRGMIRSRAYGRRCSSAVVHVYQPAGSSLSDSLLHVFPSYTPRSWDSSRQRKTVTSFVQFQGKRITLVNNVGSDNQHAFVQGKLLPALLAGTLAELFAEYKLRHDLARADRNTERSIRSAERSLESAYKERSLFEDRKGRYLELRARNRLTKAERRELTRLSLQLSAQYVEPVLTAASGRPTQL